MSFIPYGRQSVDEDDIRAVVETLRSDYLTTGPKVAEFEAVICAFTGARYAVAVANGTAALHLASLALLEPGDKVLTTPNSFLATSNAILYAGARPVFVDITEDGNIDLDACEAALHNDPSVKALYAVHFSGHPVDQAKLAALRARYGITVIEDCAHSLGAVDHGIRAASCANSDASILSFHPVKHLTTAEGGAITTNDEQLYHTLLTLRAHGIVRRPDLAPWYYEMTMLGYNYRITDIQCALGISQFRKLERFIERRRTLARAYDAAFDGTAVTPLYRYDGRSSYHLYVVRINFRTHKISKIDLFDAMRAKGIGLQLHYIPINRQPFYRELGYGSEATPAMDRYYDEALSLPMYPDLSDTQQRYVIATLLELLS